MAYRRKDGGAEEAAILVDPATGNLIFNAPKADRDPLRNIEAFQNLYGLLQRDERLPGEFRNLFCNGKQEAPHGAAVVEGPQSS